jgi:hypothetical protein
MIVRRMIVPSVTREIEFVGRDALSDADRRYFATRIAREIAAGISMRSDTTVFEVLGLLRGPLRSVQLPLATPRVQVRYQLHEDAYLTPGVDPVGLMDADYDPRELHHVARLVALRDVLLPEFGPDILP